jgi:hypothetical protein
MAKKSTFNHETPTGNLIALAFAANGQLLAKARPEKGQVSFERLKPDDLRHARVFVFPEPPEGLGEITLARAERLLAYEPAIRLNRNNALDLSRIPDQLITRWLWQRCCVRGRVTKAFDIDSAMQDLPVCNAIVHICEVDPIRLVLPRLPDGLLERLRDVFLERIPWPLPEPIPEPPFPFEPFRPPLPEPLPFNAPRLPQPQFISNALPMKMPPSIELPSELRFQLSHADAAQARSLFIRHLDFFRPYLCAQPWFWPWLYRCDEIATVRTDFNGRFEHCFWRQIFEEKADLYFWVEYEIDGVPTTVYRPAIPCHTYWDYACGTEVTIRITDPRVPFGCYQPLPGAVAWIKSIGWGAHVSRIEQSLAASISQQGQTLRTVGLTDYATSGLGHGLAGQKVRPFAAGLQFIVQFGSGFPSSNVTHYRWSYRKIRNDKLVAASASEQEWAPLDFTPISKAYTVEETAGAVTTIKTRHFPLGPLAIGSISAYRIPPVSPKGPDVANDPTAEWDQNTMSISVNSASLQGDGLYEFKLEFFNAAGVRQNVADTVHQVSNPDNLGESQPAGPAFLLPASEDAFKPFRMRVRIDNQRCSARIYSVTVDGTAASTECGFVPYASKGSSDVNLSFRASHPNHFATFSFRVRRGTSAATLPGANTAGMVIGATSNYTLDAGGYYRNAIKAGDLLGACDKAAFAENLYVRGLHTNGTSLLNQFDASDLAAFALEPQ